MEQSLLRQSRTHRIEREIDLRELIRGVVRRWKALAGLVVAAIALSVFVSAYVLIPQYETLAVIALDSGDGPSGPEFAVFETIASSSTVMAQVLRQTGLGVTVTQLARQFTFEYEPENQLVRVRVRADDPQKAVAILDSWITAVTAETTRYLQTRLNDRLGVVEARYLATSQALLAVEEELTAFDTQYPIHLLEVQLDEATNRLVLEKRQLDALLTSAIPADEAIATELRNALSKEELTLSVPSVIVQTQTGGGESITSLNPVHLDLRQRLTEVEMRLAANRQQAERLREEIPILEARVTELVAEVNRVRMERARIGRDLVQAQELRDAAWAQHQALITLASGTSPVNVVSSPALPDEPLPTGRLFFIALSAMIALMAGVLGALAVQWWETD